MEVYDFLRGKISRDFRSAGVSQIQPIGGAMKCRPNKERINMKTRILLTTIGAAALVAITFNVNAGTTLLSPRAAGNQNNGALGIAATQSANTVQTVSPRAAGNQTTATASVANDVNPVLECSKMIASPKAIRACAANPTGMSGCCKTAAGDQAK